MLFFLLFACSEKMPDEYVKAILSAEHISLLDNWETQMGPYKHKHYTLSKKKGRFQGDAWFSQNSLKNKETKLYISIDKVHDFLKQLTHCRIRKGEDPSPGGLHEPGHVAISLQSYKYPSISFYSRRLDHVPWKVSLGDNNYLIQSDCPAKAWAILAPYLRDDVYQQFLQGK